MDLSKIKTQIIQKYNNFRSKNVKISLKEKIFFLEQFSTLLKSGIPLINSLKIISYQVDGKGLKFMLDSLIADINKGKSLNEAFAKFPNNFKIFDISIIEMGELTGNIGDCMEIIKEKEEKSKEIRQKILGAFIYPSIIIFLSIGMVSVFIIYVIPKITEMYKDAKVNLPKLTEFVIKLSDYMQKNIQTIILVIVAIILFIYIFKTNKKTKIHFDRMILHFPIAGKLIKKRILGDFSSSLGILLKNGVIINKSLNITSGVVGNDFYKKKIEEIVDGISTGRDLSSLMGIDSIKDKKRGTLFPIELSSIVKIGEQTGKLAELLIKISKKYNKEIDEIVKNLSTAIEPIVIILVGTVIGTLIMAIMLPFFNMVNVI